MPKMRMNCIELLVDAELNITFRLTLPVRPSDVHLFENPKWIISYIRNNKIRYMLVFESKDKEEVLKIMRGAQLLILTKKMEEMAQRKDEILTKLSNQV